MRLFVAAEIPSDVREALAAVQQRLRERLGALRWASPRTMHLTLLFLGEVDEGGVAALRAALSRGLPASAARSCGVRVRGLGVFPEGRRPRVLWAGLEDTPAGSLAALNAAAAAAAAEAGLAVESRPFRPHLTLARLGEGRPPAALQAEVACAAGVALGEFHVSSICLFHSVLKPGGAEHRRLEEYRLP